MKSLINSTTVLRFFFLSVLIPSSFLEAQDFGGGKIVFGEKVQVNDPDPDLTKQNHPAVIIDDDLRIFAAWQDARNTGTANYEIYFAASTDTGKNFTHPNVNISDALDLSDELPALTISGDTIVAAWQSWNGSEWKIYLTRSTDGGNSFTIPDTIKGVIVQNAFRTGINYGPHPKIALDTKSDTGNSHLYLMWADNETGTIQVCLTHSTDLGESFANKIAVDQNPDNVNRNPGLAVDNGVVYCVWAFGTGGTNQDPHPWIAFNKSTDRGNTFLSQDAMVTDDSSEVYRGNPKVTIHPANHNILVVWEDSRRNGGNKTPDIWFSKSTDGGDTFSENLRVNWWIPDATNKCDNYRPAVSIDPQGNMACAWHSNPEQADHYGIHMCAYNDTTSRFGGSTALYETFTESNAGNFGNNLYPPSLKVATIDDQTNVFMVWQDLTEDPNGNIYFVRGWVVEIEAMPDLNSLKVYPNPFKPYEGHTVVNFVYLTQEATIGIFDKSGSLIKTIEETDADGHATWDGNVASGVYVYCITNPQGEKKLGKIAVIR